MRRVVTRSAHASASAAQRSTAQRSAAQRSTREPGTEMHHIVCIVASGALRRSAVSRGSRAAFVQPRASQADSSRALRTDSSVCRGGRRLVGSLASPRDETVLEGTHAGLCQGIRGEIETNLQSVVQKQQEEMAGK
jgi:hypothetical protein